MSMSVIQSVTLADRQEQLLIHTTTTAIPHVTFVEQQEVFLILTTLRMKVILPSTGSPVAYVEQEEMNPLTFTTDPMIQSVTPVDTIEV